MTQVPTIALNDGTGIPQFGFGVFQIEPGHTVEVVRTALDAGYRHLDTAQAYGNEDGVGQAIAESGIPRDEIYVTTKLANDRHGRKEAAVAIEESLDRLGLDAVDLYLIHWPRPHDGRYVETWQGMEDVAQAGKARSIGVSNFQVPHLERLAAETGTVPAVNQIELHPHLAQAELRAYHAAHGIVTESWSPLARGGDVLADPVVVEIAQRHGRTPAQIVLRWHIELGVVVFPKSVTPARIAENIDIFDFALSDTEVAALTALDTGTRIGPDPDHFG